jgi:hypothetical protein
VPACADPQLIIPPSTPPSPPRAVAMKGRWTAAGIYEAFSTSYTFACKTGAAAKCDGWGYPVTADPPDVTQTGHPTVATGGDMMLACTRMARADYCGTGGTGTLDGTYIHLYDAFGGPVPHDTDVPGFSFEAAWQGIAGGGRRFPAPLPAMCLTKLRWSTLPPGGDCPLQLPDPRIDPKGKFCEQFTLSDLEERGALLYSDSTYIDAGLYTHHDPSSAARFTTTRLVPDLPDKPAYWLIADPPTGLAFPQLGQRVQFEATIFSPDMPEVVPRAGLELLTSYHCAADEDYVTTTSGAPGGCDEIAEEGFVYPPNQPGRPPLRRWWNPVEKRSITTTTSPTTMIAGGWELVEVVGGAVRASMDVNMRWSHVSSAIYRLDVQTRTGEWIQPCIDSSIIGSATGTTYRGRCTSASNRRVSPADIAAIRVGYKVGTLPFQTVTRPYGGFEADVHVDLPGKTTAVEVSWNEGGREATYSLAVKDGSTGEWIGPCADRSYIANGTSFVLTGHCPSAGVAVSLEDIVEIELCRADEKKLCASAAYDGRQSRVDLRLE